MMRGAWPTGVVAGREELVEWSCWRRVGYRRCSSLLNSHLKMSWRWREERVFGS